MLRSASLLCLLLTLLGWRSHAAPQIVDGEFVRAQGDRLMLGEKPFVFVGANVNPIHGELARQRLQQTLDAVMQDGLSVIRVWALGEGPPDASEWLRKNDLFRAGPDGFLEETYALLDQVLFEAKQRNLRVILTLSNHWKDYGGIPQYLRWAGLPDDGLGFEAFYAHERPRHDFRAHLLRLLGRKNHKSGVAYVDDATILSWELMNESQTLTARGADDRLRWIREMAGLIKAADPHHLVGAGLIGYEMLAERAEWIRVHQEPLIDYCDSHLYPQGSGQINSWPRLYDFLDDRAQLARFVIKKPLIIGEFGFRTDGEKHWLKVPLEQSFARFLDRSLQDGAAGALVWIYEPFSGKPRDYGIYTDRPDTDEVRAALRKRAAALMQRLPTVKNPRLSPKAGQTPLYQPLLRLAGERVPLADWKSAGSAQVLAISPERFFSAAFERAGAWKGGTFIHAYGADIGSFEYRFSAPQGRQIPKEVQIQARLSSEWPGTAAPPNGGSLVRILIDEEEVAKLQTIPDDGQGRLETITLRDRRILAKLARGVHRLRFWVTEGPSAHGLCIYGSPTGLSSVPPGTWGPMTIQYWMP